VLKAPGMTGWTAAAGTESYVSKFFFTFSVVDFRIPVWLSVVGGRSGAMYIAPTAPTDHLCLEAWSKTIWSVPFQ